MSLYTTARNTADQVLTKLGQTATHTIRTAGAYDPATGGVAVSETTQSVKVVLSYYRAHEIDGQLVMVGDMRAIVASKNITAPKVDDMLTVDGVSWTIKNVNELNPAGTSIIYELQVRK